MTRKILTIMVALFASSCSDPHYWDKQERGTAIGAGGGAVLGGLVGSQSGNTVPGALIGGAAGAGAGNLIGREFDRQDRRDYYGR